MTVLLVGEQPPERWNNDPSYRRHHSPMFPYPAGSAGGRLRDISDLWLGEYIHGLTRCNLVPTWRKWPKPDEAAALAQDVILRHAPVTHAFLCGRKVVDAFFGRLKLTLPSEMTGYGGKKFYCIPHPSGRSTAYNDPAVRATVAGYFAEVRPLLADWETRSKHNEKRIERDGY